MDYAVASMSDFTVMTDWDWDWDGNKDEGFVCYEQRPLSCGVRFLMPDGTNERSLRKVGLQT